MNLSKVSEAGTENALAVMLVREEIAKLPVNRYGVFQLKPDLQARMVSLLYNIAHIQDRVAMAVSGADVPPEPCPNVLPGRACIDPECAYCHLPARLAAKAR